jgi:acetylornithine deacetylase
VGAGVIVDHLMNLIRIPSVSAMPNRPVIEYAAGVLRGVGWSMREVVYRDAAGVEKVNLIAAPSGQDVNSREVELAFVCHTDTVPYAADWASATEPYLQDGMVHGCGACDVKGILACLLAAAESCDGRYVDRLRIVLTADEEVGCVGACRLLHDGEIRARRMVIGEPTSLHVARAGKGYCLARLTFTGREAHSALPEMGASAIFAAARMIVVLEELAERLKDERNDLFEPPYTTLNVGTIQGGTAKNIIPGRCEFLVEWRPVPGDDLVLATIEGLIEDFHAADEDFRCSIEVLRQQAGFEIGGDAALVKTIEEATGRAATSIPFGSEASVFASVVDEIVVFGPGDMRTAHSDRECVPVAELEEAHRVMCGLMSVG